jgi:hypothetical protein
MFWLAENTKVNNVCIYITPLLFTCSSFFYLLSAFFRTSILFALSFVSPSALPCPVRWCDVWRHCAGTDTPPYWRNCYAPEGPARSRKVSIHIWYGELHVCWLYKRVKVEIQDPTRWNLTGRSMAALQPVLSLICCHHRLTALSFPPARIQNMLLFHYFYLFKLARVWNCVSRGVSVH